MILVNLSLHTRLLDLPGGILWHGVGSGTAFPIYDHGAVMSGIIFKHLQVAQQLAPISESQESWPEACYPYLCDIQARLSFEEHLD